MMVKHDNEDQARETGRISRLPAFASPHLPFFLLSFIYLWLIVEPRLTYYCFGTILADAPAFVGGWPFLSDALGTPGGFAVYAAGFLSLGFYWSWLGAGIIVATGIGLTELSRRHLAVVGSAYAGLLAAFPTIALFLICSQYKHPLPMCLAVVLGLLLSLVVSRLPLRRPAAHGVVFCLVAAIGFWLGGGGTFTILALMTAVYLVAPADSRTPSGQSSDSTLSANRRRFGHLCALPASLAMVWLLSEYVFLMPARQTLLSLTPFTPIQATLDASLQVQTAVLYGVLPLTMLLGLVGKRLFGGPGRHVKKTKGKDKHAAVPRESFAWGVFKGTASAGFPIALMALGLYFTYDDLRKPNVLSNSYWHEKRWDKILSLAQHLPKARNNVFISHDIIRALYHTGRLPYDMCRFPLVPEAILLTHERSESDLTQLKLSDLFLELGHVNMAQKLASELLATKKHCGIALEKLGWISIVKGQPDTARVYLKALEKDWVYAGTAGSLLHGLDDGFTPDQTAAIDRIRSCLRDDAAGVTGAEPVDQTLAALLERNPHNRMAFEYLMACYLATGRVDKIAENIPRLRDLGYQQIPTLYEEAVLIHSGMGKKPAELGGFAISPTTIKRYEQFMQIAGAARPQNRQIAMSRLIRDFGTSYLFYYCFGQVGSI